MLRITASLGWRSHTTLLVIAIAGDGGMRSQLFLMRITAQRRSDSTKNQTAIANLQLLDHGYLI